MRYALGSCGWTIDLLCDVSAAELGDAYALLQAAGAAYGIGGGLHALFGAGKRNMAVAYTRGRHTVMLLGKATDSGEALNTAVHEIYHTARRIAEADGLDEEGAATAAGDIAGALSEELLPYIS